MNGQLPPLPPGFALDSGGDHPPLPSGFTLDGAPSEAKPNTFIDTAKSYATGVGRGIASLVGAPSDFAQAMDKIMTPMQLPPEMEKLRQVNPFKRIDLTSQQTNDAISAPFGGYHEPQTTAGRYAETIGEFTPSGIAGPEGIIPKVASVVGPAVASQALGEATKGTAAEPAARIVGALGGAGLVGAGSRLASVLKGADASAVPTTEQLKNSSGALYKQALGSDQGNFIVSKDALSRLSDDVKSKLADEGFKPQLHPATAAALDDIQRLARSDSTLKGIEGTRRVANLGARNFGSADGFLASKVRNSIDDFLDNLEPSDIVGGGGTESVDALKGARADWQSALKSGIIDNKLNRAELSAANFSASGKENALRTQFRNLANNQKVMAKFTPEEQDAITAVAKGTALGNILRATGRFAVRGPVSAMGNRVIGQALGGPVGEMALGGIGELGRHLATNSTERAAQYASELVRGGPELANAQSEARRLALAKTLKGYAPALLTSGADALEGTQ